MADVTVSPRTRDRIDAAPRFTQADVIRLNNLFRGQDAAEVVASVIGAGLLGETGIVSSFGAESAVLLHLVTQAAPDMPVLFLDTGKHFPETLTYRDELAAKLKLNIVNLTPDPEELAVKDGTELRWSYDPDGCCEIRKVKPLEKALVDFDTSITGRKGFQSSTRQGLARFELDGTTGRLKFNPLANWTRDQLDAYFTEHDLPRHPLEAEGYPSIGCSPCTSKVKLGEDPRSGRWRGWDKTECGIHTEVTPIDDDPANDPVF
ncbi:phosphoadenosine phosphosulfate reductase [Sphingopyxis panaciterrae]|uniref:phosphoadenylyl-sulfate reductase n=1 Tax=Sphingopyxis panaciterrae TaxID=363841 RepID=UPI00141FE167|nr:phosphoadenylyl-sulfate reductase [Sphingopyxis panaciterrae]NIJ36535.1 phosphoadenosine phosphosulfate reductase [Sphingopyxis panaciterrae]